MRCEAHATGDINDRLPIIPHESLGVDCCGCLYVKVEGEVAAIICNECEAVIRTVSTRDVEAIMMQMAETDVICSATCTHCGALNTFLGMSAIEAFICSECGEGVVLIRPVQ